MAGGDPDRAPGASERPSGADRRGADSHQSRASAQSSVSDSPESTGSGDRSSAVAASASTMRQGSGRSGGIGQHRLPGDGIGVQVHAMLHTQKGSRLRMRDAGRNQASALIVFVPGGWSGSWSWGDGTRLAAHGNDSSGVPNQGKRDRVQMMSTEIFVHPIVSFAAGLMSTLRQSFAACDLTVVAAVC